MTSTDVKSINEIPEIEEMLNFKFSFSAYDKGDNTQMYEFISSEDEINVEIISDEKSFFAKEKLSDLITQENLGYFQITFKKIGSHFYDTYVYRPFVSDSKKNFLN